MKKRLTSLQMSRLSMPLLYSMLGKPFIVTLVRADVFFRVPRPCDIRLNKQQEDGFHGPPLGVDFDVYSHVCSFVNRDNFVTAHMVVDELFSAGVNTACLICKSCALNHLILELDVRQLVLQLGCV